MKAYRTLLEEISVSRLVGTPVHSEIRDRLTSELKARGFVVMEQRFPARPSPPLWGPPAAEGVSLIAVRPRGRVPVWLVAHYDAKGQPCSMAARLVVAAGCAVAVVAALAGLIVGGPPLVAAPAAALAALFLGLNRVTDRSPGAVDNGAGVVTVLATVDRLPPDATLGVVLLDAEEYGLLGARALVRERAHLLWGAAVINFDGIDDRGRVIVFMHRRGPTVDRVAAALGARRARWLPVVVDGLVLARAARECVTIMRGDWGTARVVHTPRDTAARLTLAGVQEVAAGVAEVLRDVRMWRVDDAPPQV